MQTVPIYLYENKVAILSSDSAVPNRGDSVYARDIDIYKGISNTIKLDVKNNDQKRVDITGQTFVFNVIDVDSGILHASLTCDVIDALTGKMSVTLSDSLLVNIPAKRMNYSIAKTENGVSSPAYVDDDYSARGVLNILTNTYEILRESTPLVFQSGQLTSDPVFAAVTSNRNNGLHSIQLSFADFTGSVTVQGTLVSSVTVDDADYFNIETFNYVSATTPVIESFSGIIEQIRIVVVETSGSVTEIVYRA